MPPQRSAVRRSVLLAVAAILGACASLRGASTASDPAGQYSYTTTAHGQPVSGTITITRAQERYQIVMTTGGLTRDLLFTDVTRTGSSLAASTQAANGQRMTLHLTLDGTAISGQWSFGEQTASLRGTRVGDTPGT